MKEQEAAIEYIRRRDRLRHPDGRTDSGGRWYPYPNEQQPCCESVRSPSRSYPWSYMTHCRSLGHVALLYGVEEKLVRQCLLKKNLPLLTGISPDIDAYIEGKLKK